MNWIGSGGSLAKTRGLEKRRREIIEKRRAAYEQRKLGSSESPTKRVFRMALGLFSDNDELYDPYTPFAPIYPKEQSSESSKENSEEKTEKSTHIYRAGSTESVSSSLSGMHQKKQVKSKKHLHNKNKQKKHRHEHSLTTRKKSAERHGNVVYVDIP